MGWCGEHTGVGSILVVGLLYWQGADPNPGHTLEVADFLLE